VTKPLTHGPLGDILYPNYSNFPLPYVFKEINVEHHYKCYPLEQCMGKQFDAKSCLLFLFVTILHTTASPLCIVIAVFMLQNQT
jgi:hypothetical protein